MLNKSIELVTKARESGLTLRLLGGLAIAYLAPNGRAITEFHRESEDMDLFVPSSEMHKLSSFLEENGLVQNRHFNALHGTERQQYFYGDTKVDILIDEFRMCHRLPLKSRVAVSDVTIPPSDLLLTKLQIFEINEKDIKDILALLHDLRISNSDSHISIDGGYIAELLSSDWGLYKTASMNLDKVLRYLEGLQMKPSRLRRMRDDLEYLKSRIEIRPKTLAWRLRSRIGDKVRWYELPEEVGYAPVAAAQSMEFSHQWMDFDEMRRLTKSMAESVLSGYGKPKAVLYIERGGMVVARMLGELLGVEEMYGIQMISRPESEKGVYILPHFISMDIGKNEYVLLVDDIADTGNTLRAAHSLFKKRYGNIVTATIAYKKRSVIRPDIIGKEISDDTWLIFDYESNESLREGKRQPNEAPRRAGRGEFEVMKKRVAKLSSEILETWGPPAAILYMSTSGLVMARLLSDSLMSKRVVSVMRNRELAGDYMRHLVHVCKRAVRNNAKGYVLLVDANGSEIAQIKKKLSETLPEVKIMTASLESNGGAVDFSMNHNKGQKRTGAQPISSSAMP